MYRTVNRRLPGHENAVVELEIAVVGTVLVQHKNTIKLAAVSVQYCGCLLTGSDGVVERW